MMAVRTMTTDSIASDALRFDSATLRAKADAQFSALWTLLNPIAPAMPESVFYLLPKAANLQNALLGSIRAFALQWFGLYFVCCAPISDYLIFFKIFREMVQRVACIFLDVDKRCSLRFDRCDRFRLVSPDLVGVDLGDAAIAVYGS